MGLPQDPPPCIHGKKWGGIFCERCTADYQVVRSTKYLCAGDAMEQLCENYGPEFRACWDSIKNNR